MRRRPTAEEIIALLLIATMTSSACSSGCRSGVPSGRAQGATPANAAEPQATKTDTPSLSDQGSVGPSDAAAEQALKKLQATLKAVGDSIDPATLDVHALQAKLGSDPRVLTAFVASQVGYEPYVGVLRGARGTLLARSGNAIDRAMLLAELLRAAGRIVRFAQGELAPAQAEQAVRRFLLARGASVTSSAGSDAIAARARSQFIHLGNAMFDGGFTAPEGDAGRWTAAVQAARAHAWVQLKEGSGWDDLDPTPGIEYGRAATTVTGTTDAPAADQFYVVRFQVEVEIASGGEAERRTVLNHEVRSADVAGAPLGFLHERTSETAQPVLTVGTQRTSGTAFPGPPKPSEAGFAFNFGSVFQPSERPTAERLRITTTGPSGSRSATYDVFDIVGPRKRAEGAPLADQTIDDERAISKALSSLTGIAVNSGPVPAALPLSILAGVADVDDDSAVLAALATAGFSYQAARHRLPASLIDADAVLIVDGPSVVLAAGDDARFVLDLTAKGYGSLRAPNHRLAARAPFYDQMSAGVLDHTVERWLLDASFSTPSVGLLFETVARRDDGVRMLLPSTTATVPALTPDGAYRLAVSVASGAAVVAPALKPETWSGPLGWWTIDPSTGRSEDTDELGRHSASERAAHARWLQWFRNACKLARAGAVAFSAGGYMEGVVDPSMGQHLMDIGTTLSAAGAMCGDAPTAGSAQRSAASAAGGSSPPPLPKGLWLPK